MTYYECVNYIEELKEKDITDDIINKINKFELDFPIDALNRMIDHILRVIFWKLNNIDDDLSISLNNIKSSQELSLKINYIKETINDVNKMLKIKYLDQELVDYIKESLIKYKEGYINTIKSHYKGITSNDYLIVLNNLKTMEDLWII